MSLTVRDKSLVIQQDAGRDEERHAVGDAVVGVLAPVVVARRGPSLKLWRAAGGGLCTTSCQDMYVLTGDALGRVCRSDASPQVWSKRRHVGRCRCITRPRSMGYVARTDTLELYVHECRQVLWTVSNRERGEQEKDIAPPDQSSLKRVAMVECNA